MRMHTANCASGSLPGLGQGTLPYYLSTWRHLRPLASLTCAMLPLNSPVIIIKLFKLESC